MKGILFKPTVWQGKKRALDAGLEAQTRLLLKFPPFGLAHPVGISDEQYEEEA